MTHLGRLPAGRPRAPSAYCQSCNVRLTIGDPRPSSHWPKHLHLTKMQTDALLTAAADYRALCIEAGEPQDAVAFADWIDGVSRQSGILVDHDGAPGRYESSGFAHRANAPHRHPDPLPRVSLPRTIRGVA